MLGKFNIAITSLLMIPDGENKKGVVWTGKEPNSLVITFRDVVVVVDTHDVAATDGVAATDVVVAANGVAAVDGDVMQ